MDSTLKIFGLRGTRDFAAQICDHLKQPLIPHREEFFPDGEPYIKSENGEKGNVRGCDVFVIQSIYSDRHESINDKFFKVCEFIGSLKDASADRVTLVAPYLGYTRQDRKTESRAPITTKYRAKMLEQVGSDRIVTMDVHNLAAEQNAFSIPIDNLEARNLFAEVVASAIPKDKPIAVLSPDTGGFLRTHLFRGSLERTLRKMGFKIEISIAQLDKVRLNRKAQADKIIGDVRGALVIPYDDMISSFSTITIAAAAVEKHGGELWGAVASHAICVTDKDVPKNDFNTNASTDLVRRILVTDSIVPWRVHEKILQKFCFVDSTKLFAEAIYRIHSGTGSISDLLD